MCDEITTFTLSQASDFLQCNPETLRRMAKAHKIPASKIGRKWVFIKQDLAQFLRKQYSNPESVVQVVDKMGDESLCQYTNETLSGGLSSLHQMEKEYNVLLGLETDQQASEYEAKLRSDLWRIFHLGEKPRLLWKEAVLKFRSETQNKDKVNEISIFKYLDPFFGQLYLDEIRRLHVDEIIWQR